MESMFGGLESRIVLTEGNKIIFLVIEKCADIFGTSCKTVICCCGDHYRTGIAYMGFCCHCNGCIYYTKRKLSQRISGAWTNYKHVEHFAWTYRFSTVNGAYKLVTRKTCNCVSEAFGWAAASGLPQIQK